MSSMSSPAPYRTDGYGEQGPPLWIDASNNALNISRPANGILEHVEQIAAVAVLHSGNVVRQLLRPYVGTLGKIGMTIERRELIDYREPNRFREALVGMGLVQSNRPSCEQPANQEILGS